jgi:hypothetical protein
VGGSLTIDGGSPAYLSKLLFKSTTSEDSFEITVLSDGTFSTTDPSGTIAILPDRYDILYSSEGGGRDVNPWNEKHLIDTVDILTNTTLDLQIDTVRLGASLSINGGSPDEDALLTFKSKTSESTFTVRIRDDGTLHTVNPSGTIPVMAGEYDVLYRSLGLAAQSPINRDALVDTINITGNTTLDLDLSTVRISGDISFNSGIPGKNTTLSFESASQPENRFTVLVLNDGEFYSVDNSGTLPILPGNYKVYFEGSTVSQAIPRNKRLLLDTITITNNMTVDLDVTSVALGVNLAVDGGTPGRTTALTFESTTSDDSFNVTILSNGTLFDGGSGTGTVAAAPGTYRVYHSGATNNSALPFNDRAFLDTVTITSATTLDLDLSTVRLGGLVKMDGGMPSFSSRLYLESTADDDKVLLPLKSDGTLNDLGNGTGTVPVAPGDYRVYYNVFNSVGSGNPVNSYRHVGDLSLMANAALNLDLQTASLSGVITVNAGNTGPGTFLDFEEVDGPDSFILVVRSDGEITAPSGDSPVPVLPGNYRVFLRGSQGSAALSPANSRALLGCFAVQ